MSEPAPDSPAPSSPTPNVAKAGGIMILLLFLSRVLGQIREMVIAGQFGANTNVDSYTLAFSVPDLLFFLIAGGALSSAFIPVFSEYLHTNREREAWQIFSSVATIMSAVVLTFIVLASVFAEPLMHLVAPGATGQTFRQAVEMSRILLPAQYAFFIGGLMFGTLYARQVFSVPGLGPNIYNIGIILGAVVISHFVSPGVYGMAWGALVGAVVGNLILPGLMMRKLGSHFKPSFSVAHPGVKKVFVLMLPVVLGLSLPGLYDLISRYYGSQYEAGVNSWLRYANILMQAPLGVFGQSLAIAVFPALSQFFAQGRMDLYREQISRTMRTVLYITIPISVLFFLASKPIVATIYEHGQFTASDTDRVAELLRWYAISIWAWCLHPVMMRGFFAVQKSVTPIVLGTGTTVVFIALTEVLRRTSLGYLALPIANAISALGLVTAMAFALSKQIDGLDWRPILTTAGKCALASIAFGGITYGVTMIPIETAGNKLGAIFLLLMCSLPGAWAYYFLTKRMGIAEADTVDRAMAKVTKRLGQGRV